MDLRKACKEYGFTPGSLEDRNEAAALLEQIDGVDRMSLPDLKNEIKKRGYATTQGMVKEDLVQRLREILMWERFRLGELRRVCRVLRLQHHEVAQTRQELLQLLADTSWQLRGIPVWRLPSLIMAFGLLDQVDVLEAKSTEELAVLCEKRGLPVEDEPEQEVLADRLRSVVVWEHLSVPELRRECEAMGVSLEGLDGAGADTAQTGGAGYMWKGTTAADKEEQKELVRRLSDLFWQAPPPPPAGGLLPEDDPRYAEQVAAYFELLELPPTAGREELKKAYKEMARKHHPDKNLGSEEQVTSEFQAISEAYEALNEFMRRCGA